MLTYLALTEIAPQKGDIRTLQIEKTAPPVTLRKDFLGKIRTSLDELEKMKGYLVEFLMIPITKREKGEMQEQVLKLFHQIGNFAMNMQALVSAFRELADDYFQIERQYQKRKRDLDIANSRLGFVERSEKALMEKVKKGAYDYLTGLLTREEFVERFINFLINEKRRNFAALLFIDFRKFKTINDTLGHDKGDIALKRIGFFLTQLRSDEGDLVARWGGDEFIVLIHGSLDLQQVKRMVERLQLALLNHDWQVEFDDEHYDGDVAADIGCVCWTEISAPPPDRKFIEMDLLGRVRECADQLMYRAKEKGTPEGGFEYVEWILNGTFRPKEDGEMKKN